jgi:hypothetical protein
MNLQRPCDENYFLFFITDRYPSSPLDLKLMLILVLTVTVIF